MDEVKKSSFLKITIRTRERLVVETQAQAISAVDEKGVFDILPGHINFISLIKDSITLYFLDGSKKQLKITQGVLHISDNVVQIYLDPLPETQKINKKATNI